ncbi:MAG: hypothetical protein J0I20_27155 [Chloroflexi bacterium]|nr:hypothetical protein [Chloroflexota bacterium]
MNICHVPSTVLFANGAAPRERYGLDSADATHQCGCDYAPYDAPGGCDKEVRSE